MRKEEVWSRSRSGVQALHIDHAGRMDMVCESHWIGFQTFLSMRTSAPFLTMFLNSPTPGVSFIY